MLIQKETYANEDDLRDLLLRALSDRSRRRIIRALRAGPLPLPDLALTLDDPTRLGYHLRVLRHAGIVRSSHEYGKKVSYSFDKTSLGELDKLLREVSTADLTLP